MKLPKKDESDPTYSCASHHDCHAKHIARKKDGEAWGGMPAIFNINDKTHVYKNLGCISSEVIRSDKVQNEFFSFENSEVLCKLQL